MRLLPSTSRAHASFDDPNLVSCAGLVAVTRLAQACGWQRLPAQLVRIGTSVGCNPAGKITSSALISGTYAPSTLGSFLREFTFGHVRQLGAAAHRLWCSGPLLLGLSPLIAKGESLRESSAIASRRRASRSRSLLRATGHGTNEYIY